MIEIIRPVRVFVLFFCLIFSTDLLLGWGSRRQEISVAQKAILVAQAKRLYRVELKELRAVVERAGDFAAIECGLTGKQFCHQGIQELVTYFLLKVKDKRMIVAHLVGAYLREYADLVQVFHTDTKLHLPDSI